MEKIASYSWSPLTFLNQQNIPTPIATPTKSINYTLTVTDSNTCKASAKIKINVFKQILMPNSFTPNADGKNDLFIIPPPYQDIELLHFVIFNRFGQKIFTTSDASHGWDGNFKSQPQATGGYVWQIEYLNPITGTPVKLQGNVSMIR